MMREVLNLEQLLAMDAQDAAALLSARMRDPAGPQDIALLGEWLDRDERHQGAWDACQRLIELFESADNDDLIEAMRQDALTARPEKHHLLQRWMPGAAIAAAVLVAIAIFSSNGFLSDRHSQEVARSEATDPAAHQVFQTAKGEIRKITLADGSQLTLDTDSRVEVRYHADRRDLKLVRGQANFAVAPDAARPFSVNAGGSRVSAIGTKFAVRLDPGKLVVTLIEGRVAFAPASARRATIELRPGQQLVQRGEAAPVVANVDADMVALWQSGMISFRDMPLSAVAAELNRYSDERLIIQQPEVARLRVSGTFRTGDTARFASTITALHPVKTVRRGEKDWEIVTVH